jgi:hypothetical protein
VVEEGVAGVVQDEGLGKLSQIRDRSKGSLQRLLKFKVKVKHRL